jgi:branched-subunit amino acid transport protein
MDNLMLWLAIALIGLGTFSLRFAFLPLAGRVALPARLTRALRFVPAAILSAIIVPALCVGPSGALHIGIDNPKLIAGIVAALIAWSTRNMLATILLGMVALWTLAAVLPT